MFFYNTKTYEKYINMFFIHYRRGKIMPIVKNLYSGVNATNIKTLEKYARELRLKDMSENTIKRYDK